MTSFTKLSNTLLSCNRQQLSQFTSGIVQVFNDSNETELFKQILHSGLETYSKQIPQNIYNEIDEILLEQPSTDGDYIPLAALSALTCICGERFIKVFDGGSVYSGSGCVCDQCGSPISSHETVWHCDKNNIHPNGYDICSKCIQQFPQKHQGSIKDNDDIKYSPYSVSEIDNAQQRYHTAFGYKEEGNKLVKENRYWEAQAKYQGD
eukprot:690781_1